MLVRENERENTHTQIWREKKIKIFFSIFFLRVNPVWYLGIYIYICEAFCIFISLLLLSLIYNFIFFSIVLISLPPDPTHISHFSLYINIYIYIYIPYSFFSKQISLLCFLVLYSYYYYYYFFIVKYQRCLYTSYSFFFIQLFNEEEGVVRVCVCVYFLFIFSLKKKLNVINIYFIIVLKLRISV